VLARQLIDRGIPDALADLEKGEEVSPQAAQAIAEGKAIREALRETRQGQGQEGEMPPMKIALIVVAALLLVSIIINLILAFG